MAVKNGLGFYPLDFGEDVPLEHEDSKKKDIQLVDVIRAFGRGKVGIDELRSIGVEVVSDLRYAKWEELIAKGMTPVDARKMLDLYGEGGYVERKEINITMSKEVRDFIRLEKPIESKPNMFEAVKSTKTKAGTTEADDSQNPDAGDLGYDAKRQAANMYAIDEYGNAVIQ